jgi:hypothetical protein
VKFPHCEAIPEESDSKEVKESTPLLMPPSVPIEVPPQRTRYWVSLVPSPIASTPVWANIFSNNICQKLYPYKRMLFTLCGLRWNVFHLFRLTRHQSLNSIRVPDWLLCSALFSSFCQDHFITSTFSHLSPLCVCTCFCLCLHACLCLLACLPGLLCSVVSVPMCGCC